MDKAYNMFNIDKHSTPFHHKWDVAFSPVRDTEHQSIPTWLFSTDRYTVFILTESFSPIYMDCILPS